MTTEAVRHIMATVFSAQNALRVLAPEYNWAGMGNLLGDYGEFMCVDMYGLKKATSGSSGYDALTASGQTVQIKANYASSSIGFRGEADLLLVVKVSDKGEISELYFGPFAPVQEHARRSERDNKWSISVSKLKKLAQAQHES